METIIVTPETAYKMYAMLNKVEDFMRENYAHGEIHTETFDLLNEIDVEITAQ